MEIQVIEEKKNPLLQRRELKIKVIHDGATPTRKEIVERIAATMNSKVGLVIVDHLKTEFGKRETLGYAKIYESEERVRAVENQYIIERNTFKKPEEAKSEGAA